MSEPERRLFAVTAPGLEPLLADEVRELLGGGARLATVHGGIEIEDAPGHLPRLLIGSAIASRILLRVGGFRARGFPELERRLQAIDLTPFGPARPSRVEVTSRKSRLYHTGAIEERVRRVLGLTTPVEDDDSTPTLRLVVRVVRDAFEVSVDASGAPLHRRGYRLRTAKAPMRETLAAALLRASGWSPGTPLHDPFCGAGTLVLEAARQAAGIAPGRDRSFDAETWADRSDPWEAVRAEVRSAGAAATVESTAITGSDRDAGAIEATLENAERAGVATRIRVTEAAVSDAPIPASAFVVTNPPWGVRIQGGDLRNLHAAFGRRVRESEVARTTVLTDAPAFPREAGLEMERAFVTRAGGIDVRAFRTTG